MAVISDIFGFLRFGLGLNSFLAREISLEEAISSIRSGMKNRETAFLRKIQQAVFDNAKSPYLKLLRETGCELGDVRKMVESEGIEGTLEKLYRAGVYVTFDEFKGRVAAVRGSQAFQFRGSDFDNPFVSTHYLARSSGSTGRATRIRVDLQHIEQTAPHWALWFGVHGWLERPLVFWIPDTPGMGHQLLAAKLGRKYVKWFSMTGPNTMVDRLVSVTAHRLARHFAGFSKPEPAPLGDARKVGGFLLEMVARGTSPCVFTRPSAAVRISLSAQEQGASLQNVTFLLGAEPLTQQRKLIIEKAGARAVATYGFAEGGIVGGQCPKPAVADDIHVSLDAFAVIKRPFQLWTGETVDTLLFTALRPACSKVLLNTDIGDYGVLEEKDCECLLGKLGYVQHIHSIRSYQKLTGEGVTMAGDDLFYLIEQVLPGKFGGSATDYQLVEEQDQNGLFRYTLLVSPELGSINHEILAKTFLKELAILKAHYRFMVKIWTQANNLEVKRERPVPTPMGKLLPFRTVSHN